MADCSTLAPVITRTPQIIALCALLITSAPALAQGVSTDIEFVRPSFGAGSFTGVDVAETEERMAFRAGLLMQYERIPVLLYDLDGAVLGAPVKNRAHFDLGASMDVTEKTTLSLTVPLASDWGGDPVGDIVGDGFGLGDIGVGLRYSPLDVGDDTVRVHAGGRGGVRLPTGRKDVFLGDQGIRGTVGLLASLDVGPVTLATDLGLVGRTALDSGRGFTAGSELQWGNGLRFTLPEVTRTSLNMQALTRAGFQNFLNKGAENAVEGLFGIQVKPVDDVSIDLGLGQGFTEGVGTTDYRFLSMVTVQRLPPEEVVEPEPIVREEPPPLPPPPPIEALIDEPEPEEEWDDGELARITEDLNRIVIREMLQFEGGTTDLLPESHDTMVAIGMILNDNGSIGHLVIEGHASEDGDFDENYDLSLGRAEVVFRELLGIGVHPNRISFRAMGEVEPLVVPDEGLSDAENDVQMARNRRVEFHIVHNYADVLDIPDLRVKGHREPWSGQPYEVRQAKLPTTIAPEPKPDDTPTFEDDDDEVEFDVRDE